MSPEQFVAALRRRWYVLLLAGLLTVAGAYQARYGDRSYQSSAVVVVKPPATANQPNQLANLQPTLAAVSYSVIQQLESPLGADELRAAGVHGRYALAPRNSGTSATPRYLIPSLQVRSELPDPREANAVVATIVGVYVRHLQDLQTEQRIPAEARMSADVLVAPTATEVTGTKGRSLIGLALLGLVAGVLGALWTDRYLSAPRR